MNTRYFKYGAVALGAMLMLPGTGQRADAQGPVRNTARGVAQGAAQITRGAAQGAAQATRRAGQATGNIVRGTAQATGNALQRTGQATGNIVRGAATPFNGRVTSNYRGGVQANAGGAYVQGQTQYGNQQYGNQLYGNQMTYDGQVQQAYSAGGATQYDSQGFTQSQPLQSQSNQQWWTGAHSNNQVYHLQTDASGREFICENGHRVYFTNQASYEQSQPTVADDQTDSQNQSGENRTTNKPVTDDFRNQSSQDSSDQSATPPAAPQSQDTNAGADASLESDLQNQPSLDAEADANIDSNIDN